MQSLKATLTFLLLCSSAFAVTFAELNDVEKTRYAKETEKISTRIQKELISKQEQIDKLTSSEYISEQAKTLISQTISAGYDQLVNSLYAELEAITPDSIRTLIQSETTQP